MELRPDSVHKEVQEPQTQEEEEEEEEEENQLYRLQLAALVS
jgi:hypothetical protein